MPLANASPVAFVITANRPAAEAFYGGTLGLTLSHSDQFAAVYDLNGIPLRLTEVPGHIAGQHTVLGWTVADIAAEAAALKARGVVFNIYEGFGQDALGIWTAPGGAKVAWFNDPDGNVLSLTQF